MDVINSNFIILSVCSWKLKKCVIYVFPLFLHLSAHSRTCALLSVAACVLLNFPLFWLRLVLLQKFLFIYIHMYLEVSISLFYFHSYKYTNAKKAILLHLASFCVLILAIHIHVTLYIS